LQVLLRYRFGLISAAALPLTLILTVALGGDVSLWMLGAVTFLLLSTGGIPERTIGSDDAAPAKPDRWLPDYNGFHYVGLVLAVLLMLVASLATAFQDLAGLPADLLVQVAGATAGWILLRRTLILMSSGLGNIPLVGRFLRYLRPEYLYLAVVLGFFALLLTVTIDIYGLINLLIGAGNTREVVDQLDGFGILGAVLIYVVPVIGCRSFAAPVTAKVIATHFSILATLAFFVAGSVGTDEEFLLEIIFSLWPFQITLESNDYILKLGLFATFVALLVNLRRKLASEPAGRESAAALSIYPDPANYVDDDGYEAGVAKLVMHSNGGVVGITGVRGAGKSALLAKVLARFQDQYCVVWTVAPVSHRDEDDLSFLMSICRTLCLKAIEDAQGVLYGRRNTFQRAGEEFLRRIRIPLIFSASLVGLVLLVGDTGLQAPVLFGDRLPAPETYRLGESRSSFNSQQIRDSFRETLSVERLAIRRLIARMDAVLPAVIQENADSRSGKSFAIIPLVRQHGFDLVLGDENSIDPGVLLENHNWLADDVRTKRNIGLVKREFSLVDDFVYRASGVIERREAGHVSDFFENLAKNQDKNTDWDIVAFNQLQKFFHRQIGGEKGIIFLTDGASDLNVAFEHRLIALTMLRGYPGLEIHLGAQTAALKKLLKTTNKGIQPTEWASIVLLAAYLDRIAPLLDQGPTAPDKKEAAKAMFMNTDTLRRVRAVLARYLDVLDGKTLTAGYTDAGSGQASPSGFVDNVLARSGELDSRFAWAFLGILLLALLPEFWRAGNFVLRGLLNYELLVLMRDSGEFLEALQYSEGREASMGFSFRGLFNLSGTRTLSARALTLQSLTDRYQTYVESLLTYYNGKLIVIIDELDKMTDPEDVKKVLLQLKGALFQRGCYYLISVSEDCAKAFRGRLIEGRDIFESTFEDIIAIQQMAPSAARAMVANRLKTDRSAPELSDAAIDVMTVFSGAIPREIVRHLRDVVFNTEEGESISPKTIGRDMFESETRQWMDQLRTAPYAGDQLIALRENCQAVLDALPKTTKDDWPDQSSKKVMDRSAKSIGVVLADCLNLLDPKGKWRSDEIVSRLEMDEGAESRKSFRSLAELQACLRLMIMNQLMRHLWKADKLDDVPMQSAIMCFRTVMLHPAIADRMLSDLAIEKLGLSYPEDEPTERQSAAAADAADAAAE
jgi:hypothetical protein